MEEDIKILEKFIAIKINSHAIKFVDISYPEIQQSLEHLIKSYKEQQVELEEVINKNEQLEEKLGYIQERTQVDLATLDNKNKALKAEIEELKMYINKNYIPKSLVKEKLKNAKSENYSFPRGRDYGIKFRNGFEVGMQKALSDLLGDDK